METFWQVFHFLVKFGREYHRSFVMNEQSVNLSAKININITIFFFSLRFHELFILSLKWI